MPSKRRILIPDFPHHITQRGTRRQILFFGDNDYRFYLKLLRKWSLEEEVEIWSYCLMPNHVHLVLVPKTTSGISNMIGHIHRRYSRHINIRHEWTGNLWQERFHSSVLDEPHLINTVRYVEQNPVRAGLVDNPMDWPWSSAWVHLTGQSDGITAFDAMQAYVSDWHDYLITPLQDGQLDLIRTHTQHCLPIAESTFVEKLEHRFNTKFRIPTIGRPRK